MGATVYELQEGQSVCPYHYEYGCEEWAIVLRGRPTLRHPDGEDVLEPGDVVCFPEGPEGAHKLTNNASETVRVMLLSDKPSLAAAVYPDSGKIGIFPPDGATRSWSAARARSTTSTASCRPPRAGSAVPQRSSSRRRRTRSCSG